MEEENIKFNTTTKVFYNPAMQLCRTISSLAVGAVEEKIEVVDAFCASGIRGIRYAKENKNVKKLTFLDIDPNAITLAKKNARAIKLKSDAVRGNISKLSFECEADFLEIDPFGTPSPYLIDSFRFFNKKKSAYLSVTATDVAVLCGGKTAACMKNYHSKPLNNEFTHETGLRILIKKIAETAAEFNMGITPLISFSDKHYLKTILAVRRSADFAYESMLKIGHLSFCQKCGFRIASRFPQQCKACSYASDFAGPLWLGELHDKDFIDRMILLNQKREYTEKEAIGKMLRLMLGEVSMPPYYYNLHALCKLGETTSVPSTENVLESLSKSGHHAVRTHFSPVCIKTDASIEKLREVVGWKN